MMTYTVLCDDGHDTEMMTVEAMGDDEAMMQMINKLHEHHQQKHPDMKMTDQEAKDYIGKHWTKS